MTFRGIDEEAVDAIASLGNRQRLEILLALAEREHELQVRGNSMSFTELYDAVEVGSSSQFSYHLERLVGQFVAETDDGYRLTYSGDKIVRAVLSGLYEEISEFEDERISGACVFCEESGLLATLDDEQFVVRCETCDSRLLTDFFPRSQARDRTPSAIVSSFGTRIWGSYVMLRGDVCPECYGPVDTTVEAIEQDDRPPYLSVSTCRECNRVISFPVEVLAAFHPAAVGFLWRHGVDLFDLPLWEFFEYVVSGRVTTDPVSVEPFEVLVTFTIDDERLRLEVDGTGSVVPV
ncbi:ArsR/SmtB family transcription factor [Natronobacterium texcoconense]|uniref:Helix-turn-helix domain-containing protein n=1 Tax=Natronobacterium texcoconense TaxID=1095778 RepID=A0A1H1GX78_NATTX|nr:winged helix-turn-helix domain-containing protein [Natronobacterium texcoconense]SDR17794.1 hypothetical protein SAMN04489842_2664 [Natronobacterium texcoconense]